MQRDGSETSDYLEAFMSGFEFVLLAIRGRLAESDLSEHERATLLAFLEDYERIARAYHTRTHDATAHTELAVLANARAFKADVSPTAVN